MMKAKAVLKALLCSYTLTGILLLILAFLLFKMDLSERIVSVGIVAIYIMSCFLGGLVLGKKMKKQKQIKSKVLEQINASVSKLLELKYNLIRIYSNTATS